MKKMQPKKSATRKKCNMKRVQHEKNDMKRMQHEESSHEKNARRKK